MLYIIFTRIIQCILCFFIIGNLLDLIKNYDRLPFKLLVYRFCNCLTIAIVMFAIEIFYVNTYGL